VSCSCSIPVILIMAVACIVVATSVLSPSRNSRNASSLNSACFTSDIQSTASGAICPEPEFSFTYKLSAQHSISR
jgi:hypothetical protein